jgi:hypothetical protein
MHQTLEPERVEFAGERDHFGSRRRHRSHFEALSAGLTRPISRSSIPIFSPTNGDPKSA